MKAGLLRHLAFGYQLPKLYCKACSKALRVEMMTVLSRNTLWDYKTICTSADRRISASVSRSKSAQPDEMLYFDARARGETIRILHILAGKPLTEERILMDTNWIKNLKKEQPLGQLPLYKSTDGELIMSNSIARYVAKRYGLMGDNVWEEAQNDMVQEICLQVFESVGQKWYYWKLFKFGQPPKHSEKLHAALRKEMISAVKHIQLVAEVNNRKHIVCNKISLADVALYTMLEFCQQCIEDSMSITPWVEQFVETFRNEEHIKMYLTNRPKSRVFGL